MRNAWLAALIGIAVAATFAGCAGTVIQGTLQGTVTNPQDQPVTNAIVILTLDGSEVARVNTDNLGQYKINNLEPDTYDVRATAPGYGPSSIAQITTLRAGTVTRNLVLTAL